VSHVSRSTNIERRGQSNSRIIKCILGGRDLSKWTIKQAISSYFPSGTIPSPGKPSEGAPRGKRKAGYADVDHFPYWPPDLFAAMAFLIEKSGAYSFWDPSNEQLLERSRTAAAIGKVWRENYLDPAGVYRADEWERVLSGTEADPNDWKPIERAHLYLKHRWELLTKKYGDLVWSEPLRGGVLQDWCFVALELLIVGDEASEGIAEARFGGRDALGNHIPVKSSRVSWAAGFFDKELFSSKDPDLFMSEDTKSAIWGHDSTIPSGLFETLTLRFDSGVANVLPKMRTPQIGATLRAFSHNLALVPGSQEVRTTWFQSPTAYSDERIFNVLVVPFPFDIPTASFVAKELKSINNGRWGSFKIEQKWLETFSDSAAFVTYLEQLLVAAKDEVVGEIHAIVFPEASLSPEFFDAAVSYMSTHPACNVELFIAGLSGRVHQFSKTAKRSDSSDDLDVNVVAMAHFSPPEVATMSDGSVTRNDRLATVFYQPKHHRWRLDRDQLAMYGLSSKLGGVDYRWEDISTDFRNVHFLPLRNHGSLVSLVCEDLARIDPCQTVLRAVGPNLVIALLMDGPQLSKRWPGRYATVLAEDPGCSVLSVTSAGLVKRTTQYGKRPPSNVVALWRDRSGVVQEIQVKPSHAGFVLSLEARAIEERTMDDRSDQGKATSLELVQVVHVKHASISYAPAVP
jgi:hypothetical protein